MAEIISILAAGKTRARTETIARMLKGELEKAEKSVLITHFADPLKLICRKWFNWDGKMDDTGRSLLQYIGTDIVRSRLPDFWADFTLNLLSVLRNEWDYVIIPDCRYPNELNMDRFGFQPRRVLIETNQASPGVPCTSSPAPEFIVVDSESPERLRREVEAVAESLIFG